MPTYEYQCDACRHRFEHFQMISDAPLRKCPRCSKKRLQRLIGCGAGIIFKGAGFYETDYKRKSAPASAESGKSSGDNGGKASAAKSESQPASSGAGKNQKS